MTSRGFNSLGITLLFVGGTGSVGGVNRWRDPWCDPEMAGGWGWKLVRTCSEIVKQHLAASRVARPLVQHGNVVGTG